MDRDPFHTPTKRGGGGGGHSDLAPPSDQLLDSSPLLARPNTTPIQLKRTLKAHLLETRKRLEGAGQLGRDLVKQEEEIRARLNELDASDGDKVDPELKRKLAELEKEYNSVGRDTARALLTNKIMSAPGGVVVRVPTNDCA